MGLPGDGDQGLISTMFPIKRLGLSSISQSQSKSHREVVYVHTCMCVLVCGGVCCVLGSKQRKWHLLILSNYGADSLLYGNKRTKIQSTTFFQMVERKEKIVFY